MREGGLLNHPLARENDADDTPPPLPLVAPMDSLLPPSIGIARRASVIASGMNLTDVLSEYPPALHVDRYNNSRPARQTTQMGPGTDTKCGMARQVESVRSAAWMDRRRRQGLVSHHGEEVIGGPPHGASLCLCRR